MRAIFMDIETNGLDPKTHCAIDIAFIIVDLKTHKQLAKYQSLIIQDEASWEKSDPASVHINGYTREQTLAGKTVDTIREEVINLFSTHSIKRGSAVFICQNPSFDRAFFGQIVPVYTQEELLWPYHWLDLASMYWIRLNDAERRENQEVLTTTNLSKNHIADHYQLPKETYPHLAINGAEHLITCYEAVLLDQ